MYLEGHALISARLEHQSLYEIRGIPAGTFVFQVSDSGWPERPPNSSRASPELAFRILQSVQSQSEIVSRGHVKRAGALAHCC